MTLRYLIEKEFKQIMRNPVLPKLIVIFPCVMLLIMPWAADSEIRNINLSVVDNDHSELSARLVQKFASSPYFRLTDVSGTYPEAMESIEYGTSDLILEIPPRFERDLMEGFAPGVLVAANSVNSTKGMIGSGYAQNIVTGYAEQLRGQYGGLLAPGGNATGGAASGGQAVQGAGQFSVSTRALFNPHMDYKRYMVPALMVMLLTMLCSFLPALNIVREKETGTIEQINVTPVRKFTFILGKIIPYWIIGFVVLTICFGIAWAVYGFLPAGSLGTIYIFAGLFVVILTGMGLVVSNYSQTVQQAMFVMFFFVIVFLMMSGLFTPVESMPRWAQALTVINPLKYFIQVMRAVYLRGSVAADLGVQMAAMGAFALFLNIWAVLSYRKSS
jgi:ABC-2 type transport system permease protein